MTEKALSPPMEAFAMIMAKGKVSQSAAYRQAYPRSANWKSQDAVHAKASALMADGRVKARIAELKKPAVEAVQMTLATHLQQLAVMRDLALKDKKWAPAILAEMARGKASGFYITKVENVTDPLKIAMANMTPEKAQQMLDALDKVEVIQEKAKRAAKQ